MSRRAIIYIIPIQRTFPLFCVVDIWLAVNRLSKFRWIGAPMNTRC